AVPQTKLPLRSPHRTLRQLRPPQSVSHTTFWTNAVLQTMLPSEERVLHTMFSSRAVLQTMFSSRPVLHTMLPSEMVRAVLQTMLPSLSRPVLQTMFSSRPVLQTMFWSAEFLAVLQTMLPSPRVLQTMLLPKTTGAPDGVDNAPHDTSSAHALPPGRRI